MSNFLNIKQEHFQNIPYTKKQIIDVYNAVYSTSKSEQNLVFVETNLVYLNSSTVNLLDLTTNNELGFLHYGINTWDSHLLIGFPLTSIQYRPNTYDLTNVFFSILDQLNHEGFYLYSRFRVA